MEDRVLLLIGVTDPIAGAFERKASESSLRVIRTHELGGLTLRSEAVAICVLGPGVPREQLTELVLGVSKRAPETRVVVLAQGLPASLVFELTKAGVAGVIDLPAAAEDLVARSLSHLTRPGSVSEPSIVGESVEIRRLRAELERYAAARSAVLILGETGTGKEVAAATIHRLSARAHGPFIAVNCGELQQETIRSDIFGHVRGAFTGATSDRKGAFEVAQDGTLFLDEIGELALEIQPQLLRVLEAGTFRPLGSTRSRATNARLLAATHCDLSGASAAGRFRRDLLERLAVLVVVMPPLRERRSDIPLLARTALDRISGRLGWSCPDIADSFYERLMSVEHPWLGNVRELFNVIERCLVMRGRSDSPLSHSDVDHALSSMSRRASHFVPIEMQPSQLSASPRLSPDREEERQRVAAALVRAGGNVRAAARLLDRNVNTLWSQIERLDLQDYLKQLKV